MEETINSCMTLGNYRRAYELLCEYGKERAPTGAYYHSLGTCLYMLGEYERAVQVFDQALFYTPGMPNTLVNRGVALLELGRLRPALSSFRTALRYDPAHKDALYNLAHIHEKRLDYKAALDAYHEVVKHYPDYSKAHNDIARILGTMGQREEAEKHYQQALGGDDPHPRYYSNYLLSLNHRDDIEQSFLLQLSKQYKKYIRSTVTPFKVSSRVRRPDEPLRIGFVSGDFTSHAVALFFMPLIENIDSNKVRTYCYYSFNDVSEVTQRIAQKVDSFVSVYNFNVQEIVDCVRADELDIVFDLSGHSSNNCLEAFSHRLAPRQIHWIGYPNTTGVDTIDYRLVDSITDPPHIADHCSEKLVYMEGCFLCYAPLYTYPKVNHTLADEIRFGSFSNSEKITPSTISLWTDVLQAVQKSKLYIKSAYFDRPGIVDTLEKQFQECGVDKNRLVFLPRSPTTYEHLEAYNSIDIALDTVPYNGTTTTCEALYMGVPLIALEGSVHRARVSSSLLRAAGLSEFVATTREEYVRKAQSIAADTSRLSTLHSTLRARMEASSLCDGACFADTWTKIMYELI